MPNSFDKKPNPFGHVPYKIHDQRSELQVNQTLESLLCEHKKKQVAN